MAYFLNFDSNVLMTNEFSGNIVFFWAHHCSQTKAFSKAWKCLSRNLINVFFINGSLRNESDVSDNSLDIFLYHIIRNYNIFVLLYVVFQVLFESCLKKINYKYTESYNITVICGYILIMYNKKWYFNVTVFKNKILVCMILFDTVTYSFYTVKSCYQQSIN